MKKILSIVSATCIFIATAGFLIIPHYFDKKINELTDNKEEIIAHQKEALDWVLRANQAKEMEFLLTDHYEILQTIQVNLRNTKKKQERIIVKAMSAATYALAACQATKKITSEQYESEFKKLNALKNFKLLRNFYWKYLELAGEGTQEIDKSRENIQKEIKNKEASRNSTWVLCFSLQSFGLILGIIVIGLREKKSL